MKRSYQNNFMPFTLSGSTALNRISNRRRMSLVPAFSISNRTLEDLHFDQFSSTLEENTGLYTTYDLDLENQPILREMNSSPYFTFDTPNSDNTNHTALESDSSKSYNSELKHGKLVREMNSSPYFIFDTPDPEDVDYTIQESTINNENRIISMHWEELADPHFVSEHKAYNN